MDTFKKLTEEIKAYLSTNKEIADTIEKTKKAEDAGTFEVIISTADQDRQGEIVEQNGWDLRHYLKNPIVLWAHDYSSLPIGVADDVKVVEGKLVATGRFASMEANPFAQQVRKLYDQGIIKTTSVGFIAKRMEGNKIMEAELLEFSFVPVPANPYAISMRQAQTLGIDIVMLQMKGVTFKDTDEPAKADEIKVEPEKKETPVEVPPTLADVMKALKALEEKVAALSSKKEEGNEGEEPEDDESEVPKDEVNAGSATEDMEKWLGSKSKTSDPEVRRVLRIINNVTSEALANFNKSKTR